MSDALHFIIDKELWRHHDEAEREQEPVEHRQHEGVPTLVLVVDQGVTAVGGEQGEQCYAQVPGTCTRSLVNWLG